MVKHSSQHSISFRLGRASRGRFHISEILLEQKKTLLSREQKEQFHDYGYLIVPAFNSEADVKAALSRFEPLFRGEFETGLQPDEWNWREGISPENHTRQICNGWKSDLAIARLVLAEKVGRFCAELMDWPGVRINQDNVFWKPPGAKSIGFHQDDSYQDWIDPAAMVTCWMAMDDTRPEGGTIEYVRHSNHWPVERSKFPFHAPDDYHEGLKFAASRLGVKDYTVDRISVSSGDVVFHHGRTWHGSGTNSSDKPRRSAVAHCMSSDARFHPRNIGPVYGRYKHFGRTDMDESFFPVIYSRDGNRSAFLADYIKAPAKR
jgi:ectoine hydroxylase-related dioxygenase (phytanoyl-CoA dioxygenase family)